MATNLQHKPKVVRREGDNAWDHRVTSQKGDDIRRRQGIRFRRCRERKRNEQELKDKIQRSAQPHDSSLTDERKCKYAGEEAVGENVEKDFNYFVPR